MSAIALAALFCVPVAQVLDRILRAQRHDAHDIEFVHALYSHVVRSSAPAGGATAPPTARASAAIAAAIDALDDAAREQVRLPRKGAPRTEWLSGQRRNRAIQLQLRRDRC